MQEGQSPSDWPELVPDQAERAFDQVERPLVLAEPKGWAGSGGCVSGSWGFASLSWGRNGNLNCIERERKVSEEKGLEKKNDQGAQHHNTVV